jgi:hypothetical protein
MKVLTFPPQAFIGGDIWIITHLKAPQRVRNNCAPFIAQEANLIPRFPYCMLKSVPTFQRFERRL